MGCFFSFVYDSLLAKWRNIFNGINVVSAIKKAVALME